ncbi:MAG TPA: ComEC/Rec2 family competence protein [Chloroflexia bacterium]|nr:ComEC/Rec2 family competence protein [Chloroflexia bacterium]
MSYRKRGRNPGYLLIVLAAILFAAILVARNLGASLAGGAGSGGGTQVARKSALPTQVRSTATTLAKAKPTKTDPPPTRTRSRPPPYIPTLEPESIGGTVPGLPASPTGGIEVHFINVGQGDSILILAPGQVAVLIDGGYGGMGTVEYLQALGVERVTLMVATHPHADHIGGLVDVLHAMPVDEVVTNGRSYTTQVYEQFLDAIAASKARYREVHRGDTLSAGDMAFQVLNPESGEKYSDLNDSSIVLRLVHGPTSFLFTGDAESVAEKHMLTSNQSLQATILKVGHHGSKTSSKPEFLEAVQPEVAIYSAGVNNPYGHPHQSTLDALARVYATVYGTDVNGTIVVTAEDSGYNVFTQKSLGSRAPPQKKITPTKVPRPSPSAIASATARPPLSGGELPLEVVSLTSPARRNSYAILAIKTLPGAECTITVLYKSGSSVAAGLDPKVADAQGKVSWRWKVGSNTTPGTWKIIVTSTLDDKSGIIQIPFQVVR